MKLLLFLTFTLHLSSAAPHSLQYYFTGITQGTSFPEFTAFGMVDGELIGWYDSDSKRVVLKTEWIKRSKDEEHWNTITQIARVNQENFKSRVPNLMKLFNQTEGVHTMQKMYGCDLDDEGNKKGYLQYSYDGEDFLTLDLDTLSYTAANDKAVITKLKWEGQGKADFHKKFLENGCVAWLQKYLVYGKTALERKVPPEVSLFQKDSSSSVVCHATGFFPRAVMISWQKNGEDLHDDVDLRETVPNEDGTFQKRSTLTVSPEKMKNNQYTCVVQHEGLEKKLHVSDHIVSGGGSVGVIVGVSVTLLIVVLLAVGILLWRKHDFQPVSRNPSAASDGELSPTNS